MNTNTTTTARELVDLSAAITLPPAISVSECKTYALDLKKATTRYRVDRFNPDHLSVTLAPERVVLLRELMMYHNGSGEWLHCCLHLVVPDTNAQAYGFRFATSAGAAHNIYEANYDSDYAVARINAHWTGFVENSGDGMQRRHDANSALPAALPPVDDPAAARAALIEKVSEALDLTTDEAEALEQYRRYLADAVSNRSSALDDLREQVDLLVSKFAAHDEKVESAVTDFNDSVTVINARRARQLDEMVVQGTLTQAQRDAIMEDVEVERVEEHEGIADDLNVTRMFEDADGGTEITEARRIVREFGDADMEKLVHQALYAAGEL